MWSLKPVNTADAQIKKGVLACRGCLATDVVLYNIEENNLAEDYCQLFEVSLPDRYPPHLCCYCATLLQKFTAFKQRCYHAYSLLVEASFNGQCISVTNIRDIRALHKEVHHPYSLSKTEHEDINQVTHIEPMSDYTITQTDVDNTVENNFNESKKTETKIDLVSDDDLYDDTEDVMNDDDDINNEDDKDIDMTLGDLIDADDKTFEVLENEWMQGKYKIEYLLDDVDAALDAFKERNPENKDSESNELDGETRVDSMPTYKQRQLLPDKDIIAFAKTYDFRVEFLTKEQQLQEIEEMKQRRRHVCQICGKRLTNKEMLDGHTKKWHNISAKYSCKICNVKYNILNKLEYHVRWHRVTYCCQICKFKTKSRIDMRKHHTRHSKKEWFICDCCGKRFQSIQSLNKHTRKWHSTLHPFCDICAISFTNERGVQYHNKIVHNNVNMVSCETCDAEFLNDNALKKHKSLVCDLYNCKHCGYVFGSEYLLKMHLILVHNVAGNIGPLTWDCWECGVCFHSSLGLQRHGASCSRGLHCAQCGAPCADAQLLAQHARAHNTSLLTCGECGEACKSMYRLQLHYRKHWPEAMESRIKKRKLNTGGKPKPCKRKTAPRYFARHGIKMWGVLDGKLVARTPDGRLLVGHVMTEDDAQAKKSMCHVCGKWFFGHVMTEDEAQAKKSMCHVCGKWFFSDVRLRIHVERTHGEGVFQCDQCSKSFSNKQALQTHIACHSEGVKCPKCPMVLKTLSLTKHMLKHTQEKRHVCQICGKAFSISTSVKLHIKTVHLKMPMPPRVRKRRLAKETVHKSENTVHVKRKETVHVKSKDTDVKRMGDEDRRVEVVNMEDEEEIQYDYYEVEEDSNELNFI